MEHLGSLTGLGVGLFFVTIGMAILTPFAMYRIITKAGFSGAWIVAPLSTWLLAFVTLVAGIHAARSLSTTGWRITGVLVILDWADGLFNWTLFIIFGFADWPALRRQRRAPVNPAWSPGPYAAAGPPPPPPPSGWVAVGAAPPAPSPVAPVGPSPGWYPLEGSAVEQVYWGGRAFTARRQRQADNTWKDVPLNFYSGGPPRPEDRVE